MHRMKLHCAIGAARVGAAVVAGVIVVLAGGCQTYSPRPVNVAGHYAEFVARTPASAEVHAFVERLASERAAEAREPVDFDPADGVSCGEAELIALVYNAELRVARLRAGVRQAGAEHAGTWDDVTLGVDVAKIVESTPDPWKTFGNVGITIPISGRLAKERARAGAEHAAELARVAQREWAVRMDVRRTWSEWTSLDARVGATREFLTRVDQILAVVDKMEAAGEMARTEARLFRIERANKAAELAALESRGREASLRLRQLMGMSPDAQMELRGGGVAVAMETDAERVDAAHLERWNMAMAVVMAEYEVAEKALELEVRKQYPDIQLSPGLGREEGQDQVLLGVSLPVPLLNANARAIAEARAEREVARAAVEATLEETVWAVRAAQERVAAATARRRSFEADVVPLVDAQYADARTMARMGEVNTLVLLESLTRQQEAKLGLVEAMHNEELAAIDLAELIGPVSAASEGTQEDAQ